jgi:glucosamine kinase
MKDTDTLYVGIDGGGTNCRGRLREGAGKLLGEAVAGPANTRLGIAQARQQVIKVARDTLLDAGLGDDALARCHVGAGLAGLHILADKEAFLDWKHPFLSLKVASDARIACLGAHDGALDGGIMIIGTGSCGYGLIEGKSINVGGWGFALSDGASGARVGYLALRYAIAAQDGIYDSSSMTDHIMFQFKYSPEEMVLWSAQAKPADYAEFARIVVEYADKNDPVALNLMEQCGSEAQAILRALACRGITRIALMGGFAEFVEPWLSADVAALLVPRKYDARDGAILLAGGHLQPLTPTYEQDMGHKDRFGNN